jgi:hypothetical protein
LFALMGGWESNSVASQPERQRGPAHPFFGLCTALGANFL